MIKALIFDADGVLVNEENKYFSRFLEEEYRISRTMTKEFFEGEFTECIIGKKDLRDVLPAYLKKWGWNVSFEEALRYWHTKEHIMNDPLMQEMDKYKKKGMKLFVATNQEKYRIAYMLKEMGFADIFEQTFASYAFGYRKPAREYYEKILAELNDISPKQILFWDDRPENVKSARKAGLRAEQYQNFNLFKQVMKDKYDL
jgi:putative hydrolase of the HAD superfamily